MPGGGGPPRKDLAPGGGGAPRRADLPTGRLRRQLARAAVLTDFDGTLAPIVADPEQARPAPGAVDALRALAGRAARVGVVSGRPVDFLARHLPTDQLHLAGLYGLERRDRGVASHPAGAERWRPPVARAAAALRERVPAGARVEDKGLSLTVHVRSRPEAEPAVRLLAAEVAGAHGLEVRPARQAVEVHPPDVPDKGSVVAELAAGCAAACFVGDDVGDLAAFAALDRLATAGVDVVKVAVASLEVPAALLDAADVVVSGPTGVVAWLRALL